MTGSGRHLTGALADGVIVLIGNRGDDPLFAERVASRGQVIYVDAAAWARWSTSRPALAILLVDYIEHFDDVRAAIAAFIGARRLAAVVSQSEYGLIPAQRMRRALLPGTGDDLAAAELLRDKAKMREHMELSGLDIVAHRTGDNLHDILAFLETCGDVIVKPREGVASLRIARVRNREEAERALTMHGGSEAHSFLMEAYVDGPEYSVESLTLNGKHRVIAVSETRFFENYVESAHLLPADIRAGVRAEIETCVVEFLHAIGLQNGAAHTEVRVSKNGPRIIESQNRVGGGSIAPLVKLVYGIDLFDLALDSALGLVDELPDVGEPTCGAAVCFLPPTTGIIRGARGVEEARAMENVVECRVEKGMVRFASFMNRPALAIAVGATSAQAYETASQAISKIEVDVVETGTP